MVVDLFVPSNASTKPMKTPKQETRISENPIMKNFPNPLKPFLVSPRPNAPSAAKATPAAANPAPPITLVTFSAEIFDLGDFSTGLPLGGAAFDLETEGFGFSLPVHSLPSHHCNMSGLLGDSYQPCSGLPAIGFLLFFIALLISRNDRPNHRLSFLRLFI
jgi:hypothetical protein